MTTPEDTERPPPPEAEWVHIPEPPAEHRSEPDTSDEDRGRPLGQWVAGGGILAALGGAGLFQAFGTTGLAAGAVTAAGGTAAYGYHRIRRGKPRGFKMARSRPARASRSTSRLGSVGKGRGKGPKLLGGKGAKLGGGKGGPKLGKGGGPKLGGKSGKLFSGKGAKLGGGKSARLLGGKAGKLGGGRSGKLLGGGRGSKLGGKLGRKTTSRLGSVGKSGGKLLGSKGKAGLGRWSKSTTGGAGILGGKLGRGVRKAGGKVGAAAGRTRTGRGFKAAKAAMHSAAPGKGRLKNMHRAARSAMGSNRNPFAQWAASIAAALLALTAMGHEKWKKRQAKAEQASESGEETTKKPRRCTWCGRGIDEDEVREVVLQGLPCTVCPTCYKPHDPHRQAPTAGTSDPGVINPTRIHQRRNMTAFPLAAGAAEMNAAAASHAPQSMLQVANELDQFGEVPTQVALAVRTYTMRLESDYPIHQAVVEKNQEFAIAVAQLKALADEIGPLFRQVHAKDLERFEAPRTNEQAWDVSSV